MLEIIKNNWNRLLEEKQYLFTSLILTICSIVAAIVLTSTVETKGNLAVVTFGNTNLAENAELLADNPYFNVSVLTSSPPKSDLVQNRYDAIVLMSEDGSYKIETIKSKELMLIVSTFLKDPMSFVPNKDDSRKIGTNIVGYMLMFLLLQGVLYARFFAEDKEKHMVERIIMSPIAFRNYLLGHVIFMCLLIFIPSFGVILVAKLIGVDIGISLLAYAGLIGMLAILATGFSVMLNSFFCIADTANMLGSSIVLLSSVLAGSFYSLSKKDSIFDKVLHILPQKDIMDFVDALEKGMVTSDITWHFVYVGILSITFFTIAILKTKKDYIYHK